MYQELIINICGIPYILIETSRNDEVLKGEDGVKLCGRIFYEEARIYIQEEMSPERKERVVKHELAHGLLFETQTSLKDQYCLEDLIEFMAIYSAQVEELFAQYKAFKSELYA